MLSSVESEFQSENISESEKLSTSNSVIIREHGKLLSKREELSTQKNASNYGMLMNKKDSALVDTDATTQRGFFIHTRTLKDDSAKLTPIRDGMEQAYHELGNDVSKALNKQIQMEEVQMHETLEGIMDASGGPIKVNSTTLDEKYQDKATQTSLEPDDVFKIFMRRMDEILGSKWYRPASRGGQPRLTAEEWDR